MTNGGQISQKIDDVFNEHPKHENVRLKVIKSSLGYELKVTFWSKMNSIECMALNMNRNATHIPEMHVTFSFFGITFI